MARKKDPSKFAGITQLAWSPEQTAFALNMSLTQLYKDWRNGVGPPFFHKGARRYCTPENVKEYRDGLQQQADVARSKPRRRRKAA